MQGKRDNATSKRRIQLPTLSSSKPNPKIEAREIQGPILALDVGSKRVGVAVSDPSLIAIRTLETLPRSNWKQLLRAVVDLIRRLDAKSLVIGFPLNMDGSEGPAAQQMRQVAQKFGRSLSLPIYLQDERLTSVDAEERLREMGCPPKERAARIDSESAATILRDFIDSKQQLLPGPRD